MSEHFRTAEYEISGGGKVQKVGEKDALKLEGDFRDGNPYEIEHIHLLEGILSGNVVNEGENVAMSTACAMKAGHHGAEIASELKNLCVCGTYQRVKQAVAGL